MKKILIITLISFIGVACSNDYEPPYGDYDTFTWWGSDGNYNSTTKNIQPGEFLAFYDLSKGALTHEWQIDNGGVYLEQNLPDRIPGEGPTDWSQYIDSEAELISNEKRINVFYPNAGDFQIRLTNTFSEEVPGAIDIDGVWTAEVIINIVVGE